LRVIGLPLLRVSQLRIQKRFRYLKKNLVALHADLRKRERSGGKSGIGKRPVALIASCGPGRHPVSSLHGIFVDVSDQCESALKIILLAIRLERA
jgi:hypothetical protein